ncbi:MAG: RNA-binding S4 domain-containing protein [Bacteroidetes bacterium]|nr:MAG: RNA-binding S4 domain-containing protein [Bacteroidota bacterium]
MGVRVDKWIWAVRIFKSRSRSTEACKSGKVSIDGIAIKPSRTIEIGDKIEIKKDQINMLVEVIELLEKRVGAKLVTTYMKDHTPDSEYNKFELLKNKSFEFRNKGLGRPTKRDRRTMNYFKDF